MEQKAISNVFLKKKLFVCLSVCLTFFVRADARDLGLMTLFILFPDSEDGSSGRNDAVLKEKEKEQEALFLYRQGVREEKRGNMYSGEDWGVRLLG